MASTRSSRSMEKENKGPVSSEAAYWLSVNLDPSEKHERLYAVDIVEQLHNRRVRLADRWQLISRNLKVQLFLAIGCILALILTCWTFFRCLLPAELPATQLAYRNNVQAAVLAATITSSASPSSTAVLEVFQVYQPVLTPDGPTAETISSDGSLNTTTIESTEHDVSCTKLLMEHSFGWSYGIPFVGKFVRYLQHDYGTDQLTIVTRQLHPALL